MRIIHSEGFQDEEKLEMKRDIASNIAHAITTLIENSLFEETPQGEDDKNLETAVKRVTSTLDQHYNLNTLLFDPEPELILSLADDIALIWKSAPIQQAYSNRNNFQLVDCAKYFLCKVHQIMAAEYVITNDDITQTRVKTEGIIEHEFQITGSGPARGKIIMVSFFYIDNNNGRNIYIYHYKGCR